MEYDEEVKRMIGGNIPAILSCLTSHRPLHRACGAMFAGLYHVKDDAVVNTIIRMKKDLTAIDGYTVGDFAVASLDVLGVEKYTGDRQEMKGLIATGFKFFE